MFGCPCWYDVVSQWEILLLPHNIDYLPILCQLYNPSHTYFFFAFSLTLYSLSFQSLSPDK